MSSGPENISSPDQADNEDTPEAPKAKLDLVDEDRKPRKIRESLFDLSGYFAPSPGSTRPKYSNAIAKRILKKRRRAQKFEKQLALARRPSDETSEEDVSRPTTAQEAQAPAMGRMASLFAFIEQYPNAPALISKYLQTFFTAAILTGGFYVIYSVWSTIRADVDRASEDSAAEILADMAACAKNFVDNRCGGDSRLPALEAVCNNWELCMNRDPNSIRRAQVSAHTFATIINSFVEPISLKTIVCDPTHSLVPTNRNTQLLFGFTIVLSLVVTNTTLGFLRRSQDVQYHPMSSHPSASYMHTPAQPSHLAHYPGMGYGQENYPPQLGWSSGSNMWNGQRSIDYQPELKRHKSRSRSPAKRSAFQ